MKEITFCKPFIGRDEIRAVSEVIKSHWIVMGKKVEEFEKRFADYVGAPYAVAVNSCTSALFLALKAWNIGEGDTVLVPSLTYTATAASVIHAGADVIFGDVDLETMCLEVPRHKEFKAIIPVHIAGNYVKPTEVINCVIEDSAHLIRRNQFLFDIQNLGLGRIQCFSFYGTKNMTTGSGGMVALNDEGMYRWLKLARQDGIDKNTSQRYREGKYEYRILFPGWNMTMTDLNAAIGLEQLKKLDEINNQRDYIVGFYNDKLGGKHKGNHLYPILVENRTEFMDKMKADGIQCSVHFLPLHKMPAYSNYDTSGNMENTNWLGKRLVSLPLYPELSYKDLRYITSRVRRYAIWPEKLPSWAAGQ